MHLLSSTVYQVTKIFETSFNMFNMFNNQKELIFHILDCFEVDLVN